MNGSQELRFPDSFLWGVATAAYQVEGAVGAHGRAPSIWDTFCRRPGAVVHGHNGDVACDQYHRYPQDVELMRRLGVGAYRFSLAWPRIVPAGSGAVNEAGFDYYHRLLDALQQAGIAPAVTLYHWDLPQALQDAGGWANRDTACRFADYAERCFRALGDRVGFWFTLNEPYCSSILGYLEGVHAPGIRDRAVAYRAVHHLNLGHGLAVQAYRGQASATGTAAARGIGAVLNLLAARPATARPEDIEAADRALDLQSRMFLDPILDRGYPRRHLAAYPQAPLPIEPGDLEIIAAPVDFLGLNYYWEEAVEADPEAPEGYRLAAQWQPASEMGWPVVPGGLLRQLRWVRQRTGGLPLYVTENGCAVADRLTADGTRCADRRRIDFLRGHLAACSRALSEGIPLAGYFLWSLIDNFEWSFGYTRRFGIVYCDYTDLRRIPKDSYYFYRDVIANYV
ncbi:MAG: beta-glucosidase [Spirochaetaceae bacterium]|nr:MAG: beta-glucosidase [Spirochaetaceae bacterium]